MTDNHTPANIRDLELTKSIENLKALTEKLQTCTAAHQALSDKIDQDNADTLILFINQNSPYLGDNREQFDRSMRVLRKLMHANRLVVSREELKSDEGWCQIFKIKVSLKALFSFEINYRVHRDTPVIHNSHISISLSTELLEYMHKNGCDKDYFQTAVRDSLVVSARSMVNNMISRSSKQKFVESLPERQPLNSLDRQIIEIITDQ